MQADMKGQKQKWPNKGPFLNQFKELKPFECLMLAYPLGHR